MIGNMKTSNMFWTALIFTAFLFTGTVSEQHNVTVSEPPSTECASQGNVTALNAVVDSLLGTLQGIRDNTSIPMHESVTMILDMVCNNQQVRSLVDDIEADVAVCPELVQTSNLTSLVLGPLTFLDLLEKFQGVHQFCECVPTLLQVLAIEEMKSDIIYSDMMARYPKVVNLTVICMKTSTPPPVNFTEAVILITKHRKNCHPVLQYTTVNILDMDGFIINYCGDFSPEKFSCALNHTHDPDFNDCLDLVDQQVTTVADKPIPFDVNDCMRPACVKEHMADCEQNGRESYMSSVNFYIGEREFQLIACDDSATSFVPSLNWILLATIISVLHTVHRP